MPNKVKCTVSNCNFWQNELCKATAVEINAVNGAITAKDDSDTLCRTFVEKS